MVSPFALLGSRGIVTNVVALVALALLYAGLVAYWGTILAGLVMSLYLTGRRPAERLEAKELALAEPTVREILGPSIGSPPRGCR